MPALDVRDIRKRYGSIVAVDGVSLSVNPGEMTGLLGPNGAGKTTTVSVICGLVRPDHGEVLIGGRHLQHDDDPVKRHIGLVPQDFALYEEMKAQDNLELFGALYGLAGKQLQDAIHRCLDLVGLSDRRNDLVSTFSGGMKRRLNLAAALVHDPDLLLLDEPTVGVDPQSRNAIFENLEGLKRAGKALVYTTHYMEEAERLCDRIVIIDHGKLIASDSTQNLFRLLPSANVLALELEHLPEQNGWRALSEVPGVKSVELRGTELFLGLTDLSEAAPGVLAWLAEHGIRYHHVSSERASLETVFLSLTGRSLRD